MRFITLRNYLPDDSSSSEIKDIHNLGNAKNYCPIGDSENKCETETDKINAGFLWLFEQYIVNRISDLSDEKYKVFIIYIMIWLNFKLNQKPDSEINTFQDFYTKHIENNTHYNNCKKNNNDCSNTLKEKTGYNNFKEIIDNKKDFLNINFEDISKFYDAFKLLCKIYTEFDENDPKCTEYLQIANQFAEKYEELNKCHNITEDSPYYQVLSTLSNDYNNFKKKCDSFQSSNFPLLSPIEKKKASIPNSEQTSLQNYGVTSSSSSSTSKLIPVLLIFGAIPILLGIAYKYSLFGFRKRSQKQHIREQLKK
ncbi:putative yir1 protein [Plasmodium yoelii yoelii]|uniref:PIR protein n=3 Tax=Plasmodium yoelii TaxID=5861 RepID=A0AAF0B708_PLAYO|nr:putative yir1 protein [Plasmodium yoelii yoelii]WBY58920.1 PIR protein [Plasmodium yoelii yoelii]